MILPCHFSRSSQCLILVCDVSPYFVNFLFFPTSSFLTTFDCVLFACRYGRHGADDPLIHENIDMAKSLFPWLEEYRDKSKLEIELRAALNDSHAPALVLARDRSYDDAEAKELSQRGLHERAEEYRTETGAEEKLEQLLSFVKESSRAKLVNYLKAADGVTQLQQFLLDHMDTLSPYTYRSLMAEEVDEHRAYAAHVVRDFVEMQSMSHTIQDFVDAATGQPTISSSTSEYCECTAKTVNRALEMERKKTTDIEIQSKIVKQARK